VVKNYDKLGHAVYSVPEDIDNEIARLKLAAMGVSIDVLTSEQDAYLRQWRSGT